MYLQTTSNEVRTGLIAQKVQASLQAHRLPEEPSIDTTLGAVDDQRLECMALTYKRSVPMRVGAIS